MYFNKNFGSTTKVDFEILMFSFYLRASNIDRELLDSDYFVANNLGISDARVRTLKEKVQLKYPDKNYNWKKEFFKYAVNANFDKKKELIKFSIKNVNVIRDLRKNQMLPTSCVLILAGVYSTYSKWINIEIDLAKSMDKKIIAVTPWGAEKCSTIVKNSSDVIVNWNTDSIVNAIKTLVSN